jgi:hypothetical protein
VAICALLAQPNRESAYQERNMTEQQYNETAKEWTKLYAMK